jgi:sulfate transport system ATP-binding protein
VELYRDPATPFVARFVGESLVIQDYGRLSGFEDAPAGASCAVRPEFVYICPPDEPVQYGNSAEDATVESVSFRGSSLEVSLSLKGFRLVSFYSLEHSPIAPGDSVKVLIYRVYAFDGQRARLVNNSRLATQGNGYNFVI